MVLKKPCLQLLSYANRYICRSKWTANFSKQWILNIPRPSKERKIASSLTKNYLTIWVLKVRTCSKCLDCCKWTTKDWTKTNTSNLFQYKRALKITISHITGLSIDTIKTSFGQVLEVSCRKQMSGWLTRFQFQMPIFRINFRKVYRALQSSASSSSRCMIQVCFNM